MAFPILLLIANCAIKDEVVEAINCGARNAYTDQYGIEYSADNYFQGG